MQKNIGTIDALMRITCGLTGVAWATSRMVRRPHRFTPLIVATLSAMKVAEGFTRFCPMLHLMGTNTLGKQEKKGTTVHAGSKREVPPTEPAHQNV